MKAMNEGRKTVTIDYTDWDEDYMVRRPDVSSREAIIKTLTDEKMRLSKLAIYVWVAERRGEAPGDIYPDAKTVFLKGLKGILDNNCISRAVRRLIAPSGRKYKARAVLASVPARPRPHRKSKGELEKVIWWPDGEDTDERIFTSTANPISAGGAEAYIRKNALGHIFNHLVVVAHHEGAEATNRIVDWLIAEIVDMRDRLLEEDYEVD